MSDMALHWMSLGLVTVGFILIWMGTFLEQTLLWVGLVLFLAGMLLGPATRYFASDTRKETEQ